MDRIDVKVLNPWAVDDGEYMAAVAARLTQGGHKIHNMDDFMELYGRPYKDSFIENLCRLPHPTLQKFSVVNIAVVGASRRFLAQITRHQNEVKFMSASLQYSNYQDSGDFVVPYELLGTPMADRYLASCRTAMLEYKAICGAGYDNDSAGYIAPQGLRNVLIISATPYQWKHMISQRICRRNTDETRYVMLLCWRALRELSPQLFGNAGCDCMTDKCREGKMGCGRPISPIFGPAGIIAVDFPKLFEVLKERYADED